METAKEMVREMVMERAVERVKEKERVMAMVKVKEMEMVVVEKVVSADSLHTLHNVIWTSRLLPYIDSSSSYTQ
jgi:hypothetical protein